MTASPGSAAGNARSATSCAVSCRLTSRRWPRCSRRVARGTRCRSTSRILPRGLRSCARCAITIRGWSSTPGCVTSISAGSGPCARLNLNRRDWNGGLVVLAHRFGLVAFGWDMQLEHELRDGLRMGLDAVYSDHVDVMVDAMKAEIGSL